MNSYDHKEIENIMGNIKKLNEKLYQEYEDATCKGSPMRQRQSNYNGSIPISQYLNKDQSISSKRRP